MPLLLEQQRQLTSEWNAMRAVQNGCGEVLGTDQ